MSPTLIGLHHVALHTPDIDTLVSFYGKAFGLVPLAHDDHGRGSRTYFTFGYGNLEILPSTPGEVLCAEHFAFEIATRADLLAVRERLLALRVTDGMVRGFRGFWTLDFRDPDGRRGEVVWVFDRDARVGAPRLLADGELADDPTPGCPVHARGVSTVDEA